MDVISGTRKVKPLRRIARHPTDAYIPAPQSLGAAGFDEGRGHISPLGVTRQRLGSSWPGGDLKMRSSVLNERQRQTLRRMSPLANKAAGMAIYLIRRLMGSELP